MTMTTAKKTLIPFGGKVGKTNALISVTCKGNITSVTGMYDMLYVVFVPTANIFLKVPNNV